MAIRSNVNGSPSQIVGRSTKSNGQNTQVSRLHNKQNGVASVVADWSIGGTIFGARHLTSAFWTTPLHPDAVVAPTSASFAMRFKAQFDADIDGSPIDAYYGAPFNTQLEVGSYSIPIYEMAPNTPRLRVWSRRNKFYSDGGQTINMQDFLEAMPVPDPTLMPDGTIAPDGTDGSIIIISGYEVWELWKFGPAQAGTDPEGYPWKCEQAGYIADYRYHPGWWSGSGSGVSPRGGDFGVSATGMAYLGPILTASDFYAPAITHPLTVALPATGGADGEPNRLLPATRNDRFNFFQSPDSVVNQYRIPEGARFRLPTAKYTDAFIATYAAANAVANPGRPGSSAPVLVKILTALRDYGLIVADSAGVIGFSAEANKTYGTPYNPYSIEQRPNWGNFGQQLPYEDFVQVAVPTVQFHSPGPGPTSPQPDAYDFSVAP